jgi:molybdopterin-containing oxidoreductase family membrane subunit
MTTRIGGVFASRDQAVETIRRLKEAGFATFDVMTPVSDKKILDAVGARSSLVGYITLAGGLFGMALGFGGAAYTHLLWGIIVGGKPVVSVPPFAVIAFELTVLCGGLATLAGFLLLARVPRLKMDSHFDPRAAEDHYVVVVETDEEKAEIARGIVTELGGELRP